MIAGGVGQRHQHGRHAGRRRLRDGAGPRARDDQIGPAIRAGDLVEIGRHGRLHAGATVGVGDVGGRHVARLVEGLHDEAPALDVAQQRRHALGQERLAARAAEDQHPRRAPAIGRLAPLGGQRRDVRPHRVPGDHALARREHGGAGGETEIDAVDERRQQPVGHTRHHVGLVDGHPGADRAGGQQHRARGVAAEAQHEPRAVSAEHAAGLRHAGQHARHRGQLAAKADVDELRAADGRKAKAARGQQPLGGPVERAGETKLDARIERAPGVRQRQRGVHVAGGGTHDDQEPTPLRHRPLPMRQRYGSAVAVC